MSDHEEFIERKILIGLATSTEYARAVSRSFKVELLEASPARMIATWCLEYFEKYGKAPGRDVESLYSKGKTSLPKADAEEIAEILSGLSDEYEEEPPNVEHLLDRTREHFRRQALQGHTEQLEGLIKRGEIDEAERAAREYVPAESSGGAGLGFATLEDLYNEPEAPDAWIVEDLLPAAGTGILNAKPKVGKSTLARNLAVAHARGEPFLGRATTKGRVLYLALEEKRAEVTAHFRGLGANEDDPIFVFTSASPKDVLARLRADIEERKPTLVIIDPLFRFIRVKDANDYAQVTAALEPLGILARETGASVLALHHAGKNEKAAVDSGLGSTAIAGGVDTIILVRRLENYRSIQTVQRYGRDLEETVLEWDPDTRRMSLGAVKKEHDEAAIGERVREYLRRRGKPVTEDAILEAVEGRRLTTQRALRRLVEATDVIRYGEGRRNSPYRYAAADVEDGDAVSTSRPTSRMKSASQRRDVETGDRKAPKREAEETARRRSENSTSLHPSRGLDVERKNLGSRDGVPESSPKGEGSVSTSPDPSSREEDESCRLKSFRAGKCRSCGKRYGRHQFSCPYGPVKARLRRVNGAEVPELRKGTH